MFAGVAIVDGAGERIDGLSIECSPDMESVNIRDIGTMSRDMFLEVYTVASPMPTYSGATRALFTDHILTRELAEGHAPTWDRYAGQEYDGRTALD